MLALLTVAEFEQGCAYIDRLDAEAKRQQREAGSV